MKKLLVAAMLGLTAAAGVASAPAPAMADTNVKFRVILGVPYYSYRAGPDYVYRSGYGWYRPATRVVVGGKMSCNRAAGAVRNHGYRNVQVLECGGPTYTFRGSKNGRRVTVYVNARSGAVFR